MNIFLNLFRGFRSKDQNHDFSDRYTKSFTRKNQHVIFYKGKWSVHAECSMSVSGFDTREAAIEHAKKQASEQETAALIHREDSSVETAWVYSETACPQQRVFPPTKYPLEQHPGKQVL